MSQSDSDVPPSIQTLLKAALETEPPDYGRIIELSKELGNQDPNVVRFSVDAGHISRLGRELVSRQETAVAELVKNAYDADATEVTLRFLRADTTGGTLEIVDDGNGMSRGDVVQGFMRLSSTMKVHAPTSPRFHRERAGRKGIGRFAAQRLGDSLTITTQTLEGNSATQVRIDWNDFAGDRELASIGSAIVEVQKSRPRGTTLCIDGLREHWTDASIKKASRHVLDLLQPYPLFETPTSKEQNSTKDPGFATTFKREIGGRDVIVADEQQLLFDHALAVINGTVDSDGRASWSVVSRQLRIADEPQPLGPNREGSAEVYPALKDVRFRAYYFIVANVPSHSAPGIRAALRSHGGIRLYRNGFRVLPYGGKGDDWLALDDSYRQRVLLPPHGNDNFIGFVEIHDRTGETFEETSSREGLLNNEAFSELTDFVSRAIKAAVVRVSEARGVKATASQKSWTPIAPSAADKLRSAAQELSDAAQRAAIPSNSGGTREPPSPIVAELEQLAQGLSAAAEEQEERTRILLEELGMLRVLASLGLTIGEFTHEIRQYLPAVQADTNYFVQLHADDEGHRSIAERLRSNFGALRTYASYFDRAVADNASRQLKATEIRDVINSFIATIAPSLVRAGITMSPVSYDGYRLYTVPMHSSEWASILFNFLTNARKAIRRKAVAGRIYLRAGRSNDSIFVEFADNGDGIPTENTERVFNAFFTTSAPISRNSADHDDILGTGLGLKIVRDIVSSYGGTVEIITPPVDFSTCFRVTIPEAQLSEVADGDY